MLGGGLALLEGAVSYGGLDWGSWSRGCGLEVGGEGRAGSEGRGGGGGGAFRAGEEVGVLLSTGGRGGGGNTD